MVLGPLVPNFPYYPDINQLGTDSFVYGLIAGGPDGPNTYPSINIGHFVDVRDIARAHVLALDAPQVPGRHKRMIIHADIFKWKDAVEVIKKAHPELAPRLPSADAVPPAQTDAPLDTTFAREVLGLKEYIPWQESVLAAIEVCLEHERRFKA
jgi:nucleoside-diphosphate-sugar epimerase